MSMWSLRWQFTNKSVTGAPCSIISYSLSHSWTLWWKVRWPKQCRLDVAAELQQRWRRAIVSKLVSPFSVMVWVFLLASLAGKALSGDDSDRAQTVTVVPKVMMSRFVSRGHTQIWNRLRLKVWGGLKNFMVKLAVKTVCGNVSMCARTRVPGTPGNLMEFEIAPGNTGNLLQFCWCCRKILLLAM